MNHTNVHCSHLGIFMYWRPHWRGGFKKEKEYRCFLDDRVIGDPTLLRTCRACEHNGCEEIGGRLSLPAKVYKVAAL